MGIPNFEPYLNGSCFRETPALDPNTPVDEFISAFTLFVLIINGICIGYVIYNRTFPPIAAKQPILQLTQYIGSVCWLLGTLVINDNLLLVEPQSHSIWCVMRRFWFAYLFGSYLWISSFLVRCIRLYVIIIKTKEALKPWAYFLMLLCTPFVFSIITIFVTSDQSCNYLIESTGEEVIRCSIVDAFSYLSIVFHVSYFLVNVFFIFILRNIRKSFNEYQILRYQIVVGIIIYTALILMSLLNADLYVAGRSIMMILFIFVVTFCQYISLGYPVYQTYFHREQYLQQFRQQLEQDSRVQVQQTQKSLSYEKSNTTDILSTSHQTEIEIGKAATADPTISHDKSTETHQSNSRSHLTPAKSQIRDDSGDEMAMSNLKSNQSEEF